MKDKEKILIKKILFILSIVPYIIFLICGIVLCIKHGYIDIGIIFEPIIDFFEEASIEHNIIYIALLIFSVAYPIYYLLSKNTNKEKSKKKIKVSQIILYISFIPYVFLIYVAIFGLKFSLISSSETVYGMDAILIVLMSYSITIPIYPLALLYQIIYYIINRKNKISKNISKEIKTSEK